MPRDFLSLFIYWKLLPAITLLFCYALNTLGNLDIITFFITGLSHQRFSTGVFFKFISSVQYLSVVFLIEKRIKKENYRVNML